MKEAKKRKRGETLALVSDLTDQGDRFLEINIAIPVEDRNGDISMFLRNYYPFLIY